MKFDPPRLTIGPLSGDVFVVTHGRITGQSPDGRERIEASRKYVVTDQFDALVAERASAASGGPVARETTPPTPASEQTPGRPQR